MTTDPVVGWSGLAQRSGARWGIPANVLLGLIGVESGGIEGRTSSAGAGGLTQFMPPTARDYGVNIAPGHASSQIEGAAHYLHDLGYAKDPALALAKYNAGPGNPAAGAGYAREVLQRAKKYARLNTASATPAAATPAAPAAAAADSSSSGGLLTADRRQGLLKALLSVAFVGAGAGLAWLGTHQITGARA